MEQTMFYQVIMVGLKKMIDELLLLSGNDLPFPEAGLTIHQPRIREIAYITEFNFWSGC
jgi:hypothetical protein